MEKTKNRVPGSNISMVRLSQRKALQYVSVRLFSIKKQKYTQALIVKVYFLISAKHIFIVISAFSTCIIFLMES